MDFRTITKNHATDTKIGFTLKVGVKLFWVNFQIKIDNVEHVLLRPDMYVGSMDHVSESLWIFDKISQKMVKQEVRYVPGLQKIFDEILVNAADNKVRDPNQSFIRVDIDQAENRISIKNDGAGIPIKYHRDHQVYVPELIFGQMMTSSNYDDSENSIVGMVSNF